MSMGNDVINEIWEAKIKKNGLQSKNTPDDIWDHHSEEDGNLNLKC